MSTEEHIVQVEFAQDGVVSIESSSQIVVGRTRALARNFELLHNDLQKKERRERSREDFLFERNEKEQSGTVLKDQLQIVEVEFEDETLGMRRGSGQSKRSLEDDQLECEMTNSTVDSISESVDMERMSPKFMSEEQLISEVWELRQRVRELLQELNDAKHDAAQKERVENDNIKILRERAAIRITNMDLTRENSMLKQKISENKKESANLSELKKVREKLERSEDAREVANKQIEKMSNEIKRLQEENRQLDLEKFKNSITPNMSDLAALRLTGERDQLRERLGESVKRIEEMHITITDLDEQCSSLKRIGESKLERSEKRVGRLKAELREKEMEIEGLERVGDELTKENQNLEIRIHCFETKLNETHTFYKEQLARSACLLNEAVEQKSQRTDEEMKEFDDLKKTRDHLEGQLMAVRRQMNEIKEDNAKLNDQIYNLRATNCVRNEENAKLKRELEEKIQEKLLEKQPQRIMVVSPRQVTVPQICNRCEQMKIELAEANEKVQTAIMALGDKVEIINSLEKELADQDLIIATNRSLIPSFQATPGMSRKNVSFVDVHRENEEEDADSDEDDDNDLEGEESDEEPRRVTPTRVGSTRSVLSTRGTPVRKHPTPTAPPRTPLSALRSMSNTSKINSNLRKEETVFRRTKSGNLNYGSPHTWMPQGAFGIKREKCDFCFKGVSRIETARRCVECEYFVHKNCAGRAKDTCGLV